MSQDEKIWLGLAFVGLVAVLLFQRAISVPFVGSTVADIGVSLTPQNANLAKGPSYLMYNSPWAYAPPVGNFLPSISAGQIGQTENVPTNFEKDCGCYG